MVLSRIPQVCKSSIPLFRTPRLQFAFPVRQRVKTLGQAIDLLSMSRQSIEVAANVNYVRFIEQKPEICVNLVSNL